MIHICIAHNAICYDEKSWVKPEDDVTELARDSHRPTTITKCPYCFDAAKRVKDFLQT